MTSLLDLFDFESGDGQDGRNDQPRRKGLRGLLDRLTGILNGDDGDEQEPRPTGRGERAGAEPGSRQRHEDRDGFDFFE